MCLLKMVVRCDYFLEKSYPCKVWRLIYNLHASLRQTPGILRCTMLNIYIFIWNWLDNNILNRFQKVSLTLLFNFSASSMIGKSITNMKSFRKVSGSLNPFHATSFFLHPLKRSENPCTERDQWHEIG